MSLLERISADITTAQKSGDSRRVDILRFALAQLKNKEIDNRGKGNPGPVSEEDSVEVLQKEVKKRKDAILLYESGGRPDLAAKEKEELDLIGEYLPAMADAEEIEAAISQALLAGNSDFGSVMKAVMQNLKGRVDGKTVTEKVKSKIAE